MSALYSFGNFMSRVGYLFLCSPQIYYVPTMAFQILALLLICCCLAFCCMPVSTVDFDSKHQAWNRYVNIININRQLTGNFDRKLFKYFGNGDFVFRKTLIFLMSNCPSYFLVAISCHTPYCFMSFFSEAHSHIRRLAFIPLFHMRRVAILRTLDFKIRHRLVKRGSVDAGFPANLDDRLAFLEELQKRFFGWKTGCLTQLFRHPFTTIRMEVLYAR